MAKHALQRLSSPSLSMSLAIHALGVLIFGYSFHFILTWDDNPIVDAYGGMFQYFTVLSLTATTLCFALGLLADVTSNNTLFGLKNAVSTLTMPTELTLAVVYWSLYAIDPHLTVPAGVSLPLGADLGMHLAPAVFLTLDFLLLSPPWTITTSSALCLLTCLYTAYWIWLEICFSHNGSYPYPLFDQFTMPQRALYYAFYGLVATGSTQALKRVYAFINGSEVFPRFADGEKDSKIKVNGRR